MFKSQDSDVFFNTKVPGDSENDGKLTWTNLKRVVWHKAFLKLLDTIIQLSKVGFAYKTFEGIMRCLYPIILILSADYEEQFCCSDLYFFSCF